MSIPSISRVSATTAHPMRRAGDIVIEKETPVRDGGAVTPAEPVPYAARASLRIARPDASFITHLIATAEQVPQARVLRRAEVADVEAAYRTAVNVYAAGSMTNRVARVA